MQSLSGLPYSVISIDGQPALTYGVVDDRVVIGTDSNTLLGIDNADQATLANDAAFKQATGLLPGNRLNIAYLNLQPLWKLIEVEAKSDTTAGAGAALNYRSHFKWMSAGAEAKSPRWAIACKFRSRKGETVLDGIEVQVGQMGTLTPVAVLDPVFLGGTTITRASLYNADYIRGLDIRIGDRVVVERGGDVIPKVTGVVAGNGPRPGKKFRFPKKCPSCGGALSQPRDEVNRYCENNRCPDQVVGRIEHWASRGAMDIAGLGEANVGRLVAGGYVRDVSDLYRLRPRRDELASLEGFCEKSRHLSEIVERFPGFGQEKILPFLSMMRDKKLMFREGERFLSLAVPIRGFGKKSEIRI